MAKAAAKKNDIIPVEANKSNNGAEIIDAIPVETPEEIMEKVEKEISTTLVKFNITDAILGELQVKYKDLKINGQEDKDGFEAVHEARMIIARTRVKITATCKNGRELTTAINKKWISTERDLIARISPEEDRLEKMENEWKAEKERLKFEKLQMQQNRMRDRMKELLAMGAISDGVDVTLDDISFSQTDIREADEEDYQSDILPEYKKIFDSKETIRLETERVQKELKDKQDQEREQFEEDKRKFEQQKKELEDQKKEAALQKRNGRISQLENIGMAPDYRNGDYVYKDFRVLNESLDISSDEAWRVVVREAEVAVKNIKDKEDEQKRLDEEKRLADARKKAAAELRVKERNAQLSGMGFSKSIGQNQWDLYKGEIILGSESGMSVIPNYDSVLNSEPDVWDATMSELTTWTITQDDIIAQKLKDKIIKEENDRKEQKRLKELEDSEKAGDSVKWNLFISQLNAVVIPTMKRQPYKDYVATAEAFIKKITSIKK